MKNNLIENDIKNGYCYCSNTWFLNPKTRKELPLLLAISSLTARSGCCFATNGYFSKLFNESERNISRKIQTLVDEKVISAEYIKEGARVKKRILRLTNPVIPEGQNCLSTEDKIVQEKNNSITYSNTIYKNRGKKSSDFIPPTPEEVKKYIEEKKYNIDPMYFFEYYSADNWKDKNNKPIKNWKLKAFTWHNKSSNPTVRRDIQPTEELETKVEHRVIDEAFLLEAQRRQDEYIRKLKEWRLSGGRIEKPRIGF